MSPSLQAFLNGLSLASADDIELARSIKDVKVSCIQQVEKSVRVDDSLEDIMMVIAVSTNIALIEFIKSNYVKKEPLKVSDRKRIYKELLEAQSSECDLPDSECDPEVCQQLIIDYIISNYIRSNDGKDPANAD